MSQQIVRYETKPDKTTWKIIETPLNLNNLDELKLYAAWQAEQDLKPKRRGNGGTKTKA